jgi:hypothetical protein
VASPNTSSVPWLQPARIASDGELSCSTRGSKTVNHRSSKVFAGCASLLAAGNAADSDERSITQFELKSG